jgi:flagellar assembly protein FliH
MTGRVEQRVDFAAMDAPIERWRAPDVRGGVKSPSQQEATLSAERLAEIEAEARAAGYRRGYEEGQRKGLAQRDAEAAQLRRLLDAIVPQVAVLDDELLDQLAELLQVAIRQFVRRELSLQPGEIVRVIRESLGALPSADSRITLVLHPDDAALVREVLHTDLLEQPWRIVEDLTVARGGVRLATDVSSVDASLESRLGTLIARLLGDERDGGAGD